MQKNNNIRKHYNNMKTISVKERYQSKIINIRNMNNFIKSVLIIKYGKQGQSILDLGCGRGGDIKKHFSNRPTCLYGVDISENSIYEAEDRFNKIKEKGYHPATNDISDVKFICLDAYHQKFNLCKKFDMISCQFSFHYAFANKEVFQISIDNIVNHLDEDGVFIATIPNAEVILRRYMKYGNNYGNEYYKITFKDKYEDIIANENKFGIEYVFELKEAVDKCVEYLVDYKLMVDAFKKHEYEFVEYKDFMNFYNKNYMKHKEICDLTLKKRLSEEELKVIELYSVIVFKKPSRKAEKK